MSNWNPDLYLKFKKERTQAVKDLIFRIKKEDPERILDLGCGPGNSTYELKKRWPDSEIIGLDNSETMLEKARREYPDLKWIKADAGKDLSKLGKFDIIFSNAAIQWIPDHNSLLKGLVKILNNDGVLAVQVPNTIYMPIRIAIKETAAEARWKEYFSKRQDGLQYNELSYYYDILSTLVRDIELWETQYNYVINGHEGIIEYYSSTGMRPYLGKLTEEEQEAFKKSVLSKIRKEYQRQKNGNVLFPFRRLFFIAQASKEVEDDNLQGKSNKAC